MSRSGLILPGGVQADFIYNNAGYGDVASTLLENGGDVNALRPWVGEKRPHRHYMTVMNSKGKPKVIVTNAPATLRKEEWKMMDTALIKAAKPRLKIIGDLRSRGLTYNIPNAMGKTILEYETQSDISDAIMSMDPVRQSESDRPTYDIGGLPLPIIHKDCDFTLRQILQSRNGNTPLDTTTVEMAGRKVVELAEKLFLGQLAAYTFGGRSIYGMTNFPGRITYSMSLPTGGGWVPSDTVEEILEMKQESVDAFHYGPWVLYCSPAWEQYLDNDYSAAKGDNTLRERIQKINGITDVVTLDYLTGFQMVLLQLTTDVVRAVVGMDLTTIQWVTNGGLRVWYKVMAMLVPQFRTDTNGNTGIVHAVAA